ncbi:hypothetical protein Emag_007786 [Eimeria magna]
MSRQTESKPQVQLICERLIDSFAARLQQDKSVELPKDVQEDFLRVTEAQERKEELEIELRREKEILRNSKSKRRRVAELQSDDEFEDANVDSLKASNETDDLGLLLCAEEKIFMQESGLGAPPPLADLTETSGAPQPTDKIIGRFDKISRPGEISRGLLTQERPSAWSFVLSHGLMKEERSIKHGEGDMGLDTQSNNHLLPHADAAAAAGTAAEATTAAAVVAATAAAEGSSDGAAVGHACAAGGKAFFAAEFKAAVYDELVFMKEALAEARQAAAEGEVPAVDDFLNKYTTTKLHQQQQQQQEEEESSAAPAAAAAAVAVPAEAREALGSLHLYVTSSTAAAAAPAAAAAAPPPLECKGGICAEEAIELLRGLAREDKMYGE